MKRDRRGRFRWGKSHSCAARATPERNRPGREGVPKASLLTAAFFVASWIHIPVPPTSVHLVLNGLVGAALGYYAFPAILIGLFFQAVMFQHGGLTTPGGECNGDGDTGPPELLPVPAPQGSG